MLLWYIHIAGIQSLYVILKTLCLFVVIAAGDHIVDLPECMVGVNTAKRGLIFSFLANVDITDVLPP